MQETVETDLAAVISDINNRVRATESKYNLLGERLLVVNQNMIEEYKKVMKEIKIMNDDMKDLKKEMFKVKDAMRNVFKEVEMCAKKDQMKVLEKYIDLWSPLHFVTRDELNQTLSERERERSEKKRKKSGK